MTISFDVTYDDIISMIAQNSIDKGVVLNPKKMNVKVEDMDGNVKEFKQLIISLDVQGMGNESSLAAMSHQFRSK